MGRPNRPPAEGNPSALADGRVTVSGPTTSPWLRILGVSATSAAAVTLVLALAALLATSPAAGLSVVAGAALVVVFFGISLLIGHYTGRTNPSGALGMFAVTYAIKVVGFAAVLFLVGRPDWLDSTWFFVGALAAVIAWQIAEVVAFSRLRTPLYSDPDPDPDDADPDHSVNDGKAVSEVDSEVDGEPDGVAERTPTLADARHRHVPTKHAGGPS